MYITKHHLAVVKTNSRDTNYMALQVQPVLSYYNCIYIVTWNAEHYYLALQCQYVSI